MPNVRYSSHGLKTSQINQFLEWLNAILQWSGLQAITQKPDQKCTNKASTGPMCPVLECRQVQVHTLVQYADDTRTIGYQTGPLKSGSIQIPKILGIRF